MEASEATSDLGRVNAFSDGLFAIAATLLALSIHIPDVPDSQLPGRLHELIDPTFVYFLSFAIVGLYWLRHHELLQRMRAATSRFMTLNLMFLSLVALLPVPTELLGRYGNLTAPTVIYSAYMIVLSLSLRLLTAQAREAGLLVDGALGPRSRRGDLVVLMFAVSIPIAVVSPQVAKYSWLAIGVAANLAGRRDAR